MAGSIPGIRTERVLQFNEENRDWMKERDISEELRPPKNLLSVPHHSRQPDLEEVNRFAGMGSSLLKILIDDLLSHPFVVLRRQCQVNRTAFRYHVTPITLIPITISLHRRQGLSTLWKGISSMFLLRGFTTASETILSEITSLPREVKFSSNLKSVLYHFVLKGLASTVITTFISANLVETVQSDIASEKPGAFDFMKEGFFRIFKWKTVQTTRLLPVWVLAIPTLTYHIARSIVSFIILNSTEKFLQSRLHKHSDESKEQEESFKAMPSEFDYYYTEIIATCMAHFMSDVLLYPLETILHRLYLQGTRTIIDNLDSGLSVVPIISRYEGMMDCFHSILDDEGIYGFYRGFGALIVQYALQLFILKGIKRVLNDISEFSKSEN